VKIKQIKGQVSKEEQREIEKIVKKNRSKFLKEWNKRKAK
jgi:hypothetical protein